MCDDTLHTEVKKNNAPKCGNTFRASDHNVRGTNIMACTKSTQTRPEFTWRFLTLGEFTNQIVNVTASTEREAREKTPAGCVCILACRFRLEEVQHV
ncbi:host cell division inhibitor Icd-like protein [Enterobacter hormaechei]